MHNRKIGLYPRAFTLIELLVVIAVIALLISILLPALASARRTARMAVCQSNLHQFAVAHAAYSADFKTFIGAFNGDRVDRGQFDFSFPSISQIAKQAKRFITDIDGKRPTALQDFSIGSFFAKRSVAEQFEHLMLTAYMGSSAFVPATLCPEDRPRLQARIAPYTDIARIQSKWGFTFSKPENGVNAAWFPYSSSYQLTPAAAAYSFFTDVKQYPAGYYQATTHDTYVPSHVLFGGRKTSHIAFPSQKVAIMDSLQRHVGKDLVYADPTARQPLLFWDGAVVTRTTADANLGWYSERLYSDNKKLPETRFLYAPDTGFEPALSTAASGTQFAGYYRWTRGGLHGIDFVGGEIQGTIGEVVTGISR